MKNENKVSRKEAVSAMDKKQRKKYYLKRACIIVLILLALLTAILIAVKLMSDAVVSDEPLIEQIDEVYPTYTPFPAEWNIKLSEDEEYLSLNTKIMYGVGESGRVYYLEDF